MRDNSKGKGSVIIEIAITYVYVYTVEHRIAVAEQGIGSSKFEENGKKSPLEDPN